MRWPQPSGQAHEEPRPSSAGEASAFGSAQLEQAPAPAGANLPSAEQDAQYLPRPTQYVLSGHCAGKSG